MNKYLIPVLVAVLTVFTMPVIGQEILHITSGCDWDDDAVIKDTEVYESSNEAERIIQKVTSAIGLEPNFIIKSAAIKNAKATSVNGQRYILYSTTYLENFKSNANTQWAAYCVLAHEIAHHLNNHDFSIENPQKRRIMELQADRFAGNVLQKMGATLEQAQAGIQTFSLEGETAQHPNKLSRLEAVASGWKLAKEGAVVKVEPYVAPKSVNNEAAAREWFDKGYDADEAKNYEQAIEYYSKAIRLNPNYADAYCNRGVSKNNLGKYNEAIEDCNQALRLNPNYAEAYINRGIAKESLRKYNEALEDYNQAILLNPNEAKAYNNRALAKYHLMKYNEAIVDFNQAIRLNPNYANAYYNRGVTKSKLGRYSEAYQDFDKSLQLNPNDAMSIANKGCALVGMGDKDRMGEAIDLINKGLKLDPSLSWAKDCKQEALTKAKD